LDWAPAWSPDGKRIAFQSERDGDYEIFVMDADGTNVVGLNQNGTGPDWR
jgi:TolB protein